MTSTKDSLISIERETKEMNLADNTESELGSEGYVVGEYIFGKKIGAGKLKHCIF